MLVDWSTSRVMSSIKNLLPMECLVVRDGQQQSIPGTDIVSGDVLRIKLGDKLPADVRFVQVSPDAKFDRSVLTGLYIEWPSASMLTIFRRIHSCSRYCGLNRGELPRDNLHWHGWHALHVW